MLENASGSVEAGVIDAKGPATCTAQAFSDGDPAVLALVRAAQLAREEETVPFGGPIYDAQNKGTIETANKMVEGWSACLSKRNPGTACQSITGCILSRLPIKQDGLTPYQHVKSRDVRLGNCHLGQEGESYRRAPSRQRGWEAHCSDYCSTL